MNTSEGRCNMMEAEELTSVLIRSALNLWRACLENRSGETTVLEQAWRRLMSWAEANDITSISRACPLGAPKSDLRG